MRVPSLDRWCLSRALNLGRRGQDRESGRGDLGYGGRGRRALEHGSSVMVVPRWRVPGSPSPLRGSILRSISRSGSRSRASGTRCGSMIDVLEDGAKVPIITRSPSVCETCTRTEVVQLVQRELAWGRGVAVDASDGYRACDWGAGGAVMRVGGPKANPIAAPPRRRAPLQHTTGRRLERGGPEADVDGVWWVSSGSAWLPTICGGRLSSP